MKRLLLHVCCAPCATHVIEELKEQYDLTLFFYNPCIEPLEEYDKRLKATEDYAEKFQIPLIIGDFDNIQYHELIKGSEQEKEGGERCKICFYQRLQKSAQLAILQNFDLFCTTLTISPYKNAELINQIGKEIQEEFEIEFLEKDFKKGYMNSVQLSKKHNLYRQTYCGCIYSKAT